MTNSPEPQIDSSASTSETPNESKSGLKLALDFAPVLLFFVAYKFFGVMIATAILVLSTVLSVIISYLIFRRLEIMPILTAVVVTILGGLTLYLNDETFVKMKPTLVYAAFALILLSATLFNFLPIKALLGQALELALNQWRALQLLWAGFFFAMAGLNEYVWRNYSFETWITFKTFGFLPLTLVFTVISIGYFITHTETPSTD